MNNKYICPITQMPIVNGGMTCSGHIFEYDAIIKWLKTSNINPSTGMPLGSTFVRKFDINDNSEIIEKLIDDAKKSYSAWCPLEKSWNDLEKLYREKLAIKNSFDFQNDKWIKYDIMKRKRFPELSNKAFMSACCNKNLIDDGDIIERPHGTGSQFDFIDLSNLVIKEKSFKSQIFQFTNLNKTVFISCDLSRVQFIGCNMNGTQFINCIFIGEEVCFYKVIGLFTFEKCEMEYVDKWITTGETSEILKILKSRGLSKANFNTYDKKINVISII